MFLSFFGQDPSGFQFQLRTNVLADLSVWLRLVSRWKKEPDISSSYFEFLVWAN